MWDWYQIDVSPISKSSYLYLKENAQTLVSNANANLGLNLDPDLFPKAIQRLKNCVYINKNTVPDDDFFKHLKTFLKEESERSHYYIASLLSNYHIATGHWIGTLTYCTFYTYIIDNNLFDRAKETAELYGLQLNWRFFNHNFTITRRQKDMPLAVFDSYFGEHEIKLFSSNCTLQTLPEIADYLSFKLGSDIYKSYIYTNHHKLEADLGKLIFPYSDNLIFSDYNNQYTSVIGFYQNDELTAIIGFTPKLYRHMFVRSSKLKQKGATRLRTRLDQLRRTSRLLELL